MRHQGLRERIGHIIFETDTPAARRFDVVLLWAILLSILLVLLESVPEIRAAYRPLLFTLEWFFTLLFTLEYALRIYSARKRWRYITSFFGIIDLLAIIPGYLALLFAGSPYFIVIRSLRLLRVFRILKLVQFFGEADILLRALKAGLPKITVFLFVVLNFILIVGSLAYVFEGPEHGFTSIPIAMYWAIVTLTTVGYGDIVPGTPFGKFLANATMLMGYGTMAIPSGIVTVSLVQTVRQERNQRSCETCSRTQHDEDADYCIDCGSRLPAVTSHTPGKG